MKHTIFQLTLLGAVILGVNLAATGQIVQKNELPKMLHIDLISGGVSYKSLNDTTVKAAVTNSGNKDAAASTLKFTFTKDGKTTNLQFPVSALKAKTNVWVTVPLGVNLYLVSFCVTADAFNQIKESNEKNNTLCDKWEGKP